MCVVNEPGRDKWTSLGDVKPKLAKNSREIHIGSQQIRASVKRTNAEIA